MFKIVKTIFSEIVEQKDVAEFISILEQDEEKYYECLEWIEVNTTLHNGIYFPNETKKLQESLDSDIDKSLERLKQSLDNLDTAIRNYERKSTIRFILDGCLFVVVFSFGWSIPSIIRYFYGS